MSRKQAKAAGKTGKQGRQVASGAGKVRSRQTRVPKGPKPAATKPLAVTEEQTIPENVPEPAPVKFEDFGKGTAVALHGQDVVVPATKTEHEEKPTTLDERLNRPPSVKTKGKGKDEASPVQTPNPVSGT